MPFLQEREKQKEGKREKIEILPTSLEDMGNAFQART